MKTVGTNVVNREDYPIFSGRDILKHTISDETNFDEGTFISDIYKSATKGEYSSNTIECLSQLPKQFSGLSVFNPLISKVDFDIDAKKYQAVITHKTPYPLIIKLFEQNADRQLVEVPIKNQIKFTDASKIMTHFIKHLMSSNQTGAFLDFIEKTSDNFGSETFPDGEKNWRIGENNIDKYQKEISKLENSQASGEIDIDTNELQEMINELNRKIEEEKANAGIVPNITSDNFNLFKNTMVNMINNSSVDLSSLSEQEKKDIETIAGSQNEQYLSSLTSNLLQNDTISGFDIKKREQTALEYEFVFTDDKNSHVVSKKCLPKSEKDWEKFKSDYITEAEYKDITVLAANAKKDLHKAYHLCKRVMGETRADIIDYFKELKNNPNKASNSQLTEILQKIQVLNDEFPSINFNAKSIFKIFEKDPKKLLNMPDIFLQKTYQVMAYYDDIASISLSDDGTRIKQNSNPEVKYKKSGLAYVDAMLEQSRPKGTMDEKNTFLPNVNNIYSILNAVTVSDNEEHKPSILATKPKQNTIEHKLATLIYRALNARDGKITTANGEYNANLKNALSALSKMAYDSKDGQTPRIKNKAYQKIGPLYEAVIARFNECTADDDFYDFANELVSQKEISLKSGRSSKKFTINDSFSAMLETYVDDISANQQQSTMYYQHDIVSSLLSAGEFIKPDDKRLNEVVSFSNETNDEARKRVSKAINATVAYCKDVHSGAMKYLQANTKSEVLQKKIKSLYGNANPLIGQSFVSYRDKDGKYQRFLASYGNPANVDYRIYSGDKKHIGKQEILMPTTKTFTHELANIAYDDMKENGLVAQIKIANEERKKEYRESFSNSIVSTQNLREMIAARKSKKQEKVENMTNAKNTVSETKVESTTNTTKTAPETKKQKESTKQTEKHESLLDLATPDESLETAQIMETAEESIFNELDNMDIPDEFGANSFGDFDDIDFGGIEEEEEEKTSIKP